MEGTVSSDETSVLANSTRNISRPTKGLRNTLILTPWHPVQRLKLKKGKKTFSQETLQKKKGKSTKEANVHTNPQQESTRNKCRRRRARKKTNKNQMDMVNTEKRKEKQEVQLLNYQQIPLPCLRNKTKARQKINENNREKSKSRKVNRNSAGLCTNEYYRS